MKTPKLRDQRWQDQGGRWHFTLFYRGREIALSGQSYPDTDDGLYWMAQDIALLVPGTVAQKPPTFKR